MVPNWNYIEKITRTFVFKDLVETAYLIGEKKVREKFSHF